MKPERKIVPIHTYKVGSLPNFERLTALLNRQPRPRFTLCAVVSLAEPLPDSSNDGLKKAKVLV